jgi:hypothetical protein
MDAEREIVPNGWQRPTIEPEELSMIYATALARWTCSRRSSHEELITQIRFQVFLMREAKASFYQCYHRILQTVMHTCLMLNLPDEVMFRKQVSAMKKLQTVARLNETAGVSQEERLSDWMEVESVLISLTSKTDSEDRLTESPVGRRARRRVASTCWRSWSVKRSWARVWFRSKAAVRL